MQAKNIRFRRLINRPAQKTPSDYIFTIDIDEAIEIFTESYMIDDWSQRTLEFHLENLSVFKKYLSQKGSKPEIIPFGALKKSICIVANGLFQCP